MRILYVRLGTIRKQKRSIFLMGRRKTKQFSGLHCALCVFSKLKQGLLNLALCFINWNSLHYAVSLKNVATEESSRGLRE